MGRLHDFPSSIDDALRAGMDLVLPTCCVACGNAGSTVCLGCAAACVAVVHEACPSNAPLGFPRCLAAAPYAGVLRRILLNYKERTRRSLARYLAPVLSVGLAVSLAAQPNDGLGVALVPVPTALTARRRRGGDHVLPLLRRALASSGLAAQTPVMSVLRAHERPADSVGLTARARSCNIAGAFAPRRWAPPGLGRSVLLVDDVVASGATLAEAARTLREMGYRVVGAVVLAGVD